MTGRYFQDWLLLESDWNWRLQPDRGGALRAVGDIGSHWLDLMTFVTGQHVSEVMADLSTFIGTRREPTGPVETFSTDRSAETPRARDLDRGHGVHPAPLRRRRPGRGEHQPDQPGPEELARLRDRRLRRRLGLGLRAAGPGVGRPPRAPQRDPDPQPGPDGRGGPGRLLAAGRTRRGVLRHLLRPFPGRLRGRGGRGALLPPQLSHVRGRPRRDARRRRDRAERPRGSMGRGGPQRDGRHARTPSPRSPSDEARSADRALPRDAAQRGRRLDGRQRLRKHRDRLLAALERADPPLRRHVPHRCRGPLGVAGDRDRRRDSRARA